MHHSTLALMRSSHSYWARLVTFLLVLLPVHSDGRADSYVQDLYMVGITQRAFVPSGPYNWRGAATHALVTVIWYPADPGSTEEEIGIGAPDRPIATAGKAARNAQVLSGNDRYPLIVLSHGTGGSALMMAWLGRELAAHGYIVAAVNHPGNNALEPYTVQGFTLWWERAKDLSVVIDKMLADSVMGARIDPGRIAAVGFSLGGYTMIEIAGGVTDPALFEEYVASHPGSAERNDPPEFPGLTARAEFLAQSDSTYREAFSRASLSYLDPRVRAIVALAPALGPAFRVESLKRIQTPIMIIAGAADTLVPVRENAEFFASHIPNVALTILPRGVGHYTFLGVCTEFGRASLAELCIDAPGVERESVHAMTVTNVLAFFRAHL